MSVSVVYLAYLNEDVGYGIKTVENFLNSYKKYNAGLEHSLVIIAKNWTNKILYKELCKLASENNAKIIDLPDDGWDLGAYFRVSKILDSEYVLFTGSSTKILSDNWLLNLYNAFKNDDTIQLVGSMGSWGYTIKIKAFPNYHIRTCTFMIKRNLFLEYASTQKFPQTKEDTHKMEHGENSLTNFIFNKGYSAVVVNCDGEIFTPENWLYSKTYHYPIENKSLFSDKRSEIYHGSIESEKRRLELGTWGQYLTKTKIKIFASYQKITPIFLTDVFQPIFNGAIKMPNRVNAIKDDMGINISEKNSYYGELTGHYWVWKNFLPRTDSEYIGFCQHCSFLDFNIHQISSAPFQPTLILNFEKMLENYTQENILNSIKNYDIILPEAFSLEKTLYDDCITQHNQKDIDSALDLIKELYPDYTFAMQQAMFDNKMYSCFVLVMKKNLLNEYLSWIFDVLAIFEQRTPKEALYITSPACIAEILFNIWLVYNVKNKNLKLLNTTSVYIPMEL